MQLFLFLLFLPFSLSAHILSLQVRGGNLFPSSELLNDIYSGNKIEGELEATLWIPCTDLYLWTNINGLKKEGHFETDEITTIEIYPISSGLKYLIPICGLFSPYIGGGISYTWINTNNKLDSLKTHIHAKTYGGVIKSGIIINLTSQFFMDFYADYYFSKISSENTFEEIGGLRTGAGIGIFF